MPTEHDRAIQPGHRVDRLDHVQYSVFLCALNPQELAGLRATLSQIIHGRDDQVLIVDLGPAGNDANTVLECLGKCYNPPTRVRIV